MRELGGAAGAGRGWVGRRARALLALSLVLSSLVVLVAPQPAEAAIIRSFSSRYTTNTTGDIRLVGNTLMTCAAAAAGCTAAQAGTGTTLNNNDFTMGYVDVDAVASTFNSSSATFALPAGASVLHAGLYWGANTTAGTSGAAAPDTNARSRVLIRAPGSAAYATATATTTDVEPTTSAYQSYADVTAIVAAGKAGTYTVANVQAGTGRDRYAGWALVVAYRDPTQPVRNLTIFDGFATVASNNTPTLTIPVSGFQTPPAGPVRTSLGTVVYEGDAGLTGDSLQLNSTTISNGANPASNIFNSTTTDLATPVAGRTPSYANNLGIDVDRFDASGILPNGATSANLTLATGGETFYPGVVTFATEVFAPRLDAAKSATDLNGGALLPGDQIRYDLTVTNNGLDTATGVVLEDVIPAGTTYVPGSLAVTSGAGTGARTDAAGDDTAELLSGPARTRFRLGTGATATAGGSLAVGATTSVRFTVAVNPAATDGTSIDNTATISYAGAQSGTAFSGGSTTTSGRVTRQADLVVAKSTTPDPVTSPSPATSTITVRNDGPFSDPGVTVTDVLPAGATATSSTSSQGSCSTAGSTITCAIGALAAGATATVTVRFTSTTSGAATNTASASGSGTADPTPATNTATSTIRVNLPPTAGADRAATAEDVAVTIPVLDDDADDVGIVRSTLAIASPPAQGTATVQPDGTIRYVPAPNATGTATFSYRVCDTDGACTTATVTVAITAVDDPPAAGDDAATTTEDVPVTVAVLANDADVDSALDPASVRIVVPPTSGTATVLADGRIRYVPAPNASGTVTLTYEVCGAGGGACATAVATIQVIPVPDAPVARDDAAVTTEDAPVTVDVLADDVDPDGDLVPGSTTVVSAPTKGTTSVDPATGRITYAPGPNATGTDAFTYRVCDGGGRCAEAVVRVTIDPVADAPTAADDAAATDEDVPVGLALVANDADADGDLAPSTVRLVRQPARGTVTLAADGSATYVPAPQSSGVDGFDYEVCDATGLCATATATITVRPVADPPEADDDTAATAEDTPVEIDVLDDDRDPDGDLDPATLTITAAPTKGTATVDPATRRISYVPAPNTSGTDAFRYRVCDAGGRCAEAGVEVSVAPVDDAPTAGDDQATTAEDAAVVLDVLGNDADVEGQLLPGSVRIVHPPAGGTATVDPATGRITYAPAANASGTVTFTYEVCDAAGLCATATASVVVTPVDDAPVARDDAASADERVPTQIDVLANDTDVEGPLDPGSVEVVAGAGPTKGTATVDPSTGRITYTSIGEAGGTDTFAYRACDQGSPARCDTATVTVTIGAVDDPPTADAEAVATDEDTAITIDVLAGDADPEGQLVPGTTAVLTPPSSGTTSVDAATGRITYVPAPDTNGTDAFTYRVCDAAGQCATATVTVEVRPVADPPVADDATGSTAEGAPTTIDVLAGDDDPDGDLDPTSVTIVSGPANGSVAVDGTTGAVTYAPTGDFAGTDAFRYRVCDRTTPTPLCDEADVTVVVTAVPDAPRPADDAATTAEDVAVAIDLLGGDVDPEGDLDPASTTVTDGPSRGTVVVDPADGRATYTPFRDVSGTDTFTYQVCDRTSPTPRCATATATVTITPVEDDPVAGDDAVATPEDVATTIDVLADDADPEGQLDPTTVRTTAEPASGTAVVDPATGAITFTPAPDATGTVTFEYEVCDRAGRCDRATVTVLVGAEADRPVAAADAATTAEDVAVAIPVAGNDADADGDLEPASVRIVAAPTQGTATLDPATGTVTYAPFPGSSGTDAFSYEVCDRTSPTPLCATAQVAVTVTAVADAPVAASTSAVTAEDVATTVDPVASTSDQDGDVDPGSVRIVDPPASGTATVDPSTGVITYAPAPNASGTATFTYEVCDRTSPTPLCSTATATITVIPVDDPPTAADDAATTAEDVPVTVDVLASDADVEGQLQPGSVRIVAQPERGTATVESATGAITYRPAPNTSGVDALEYEVCDAAGQCATATLTVTVSPVDDAPTAGDDEATTDEDAPVAIDVLADDADVDSSLDPASVQVVTGPARGATTVDPATGRITYQPAPDANGADSFTYRVCDAGGLCATATVVVTVAPVDDAPVAGDDAAATLEEQPVALDLLANDGDVDSAVDPASATVLRQPALGSVVLDPATGRATYTPRSDATGPDGFTYRVCDVEGRCDEATATITISPVNDPPVAGDDPGVEGARVEVQEDTPLAIDVLANDRDVDGTPLPSTVRVTTPPARGTATVDPATGRITYAPASEVSGDDQLAYEVCDDGGLCSTAVVLLRVLPVADAPVAADDATTTPEDTPRTISVLLNDVDPDGDALTVTAVGTPSSGSAVLDGDGTITYTPAPDATGTATFTYTVADPSGRTSTATVTVAVGPVNDPPRLVDDTATTAEDAAVVIAVLGNDVDADGRIVPSTVRAILVPPNLGTVAVDPATGAITYTPSPDANGTDSFRYEACDEDGACSVATVTVTTSPVDDAPTAADDSAATLEDEPTTIAVLANDADRDGQLVPGTVAVVRPPARGTATVDPATGAITYVPARDANGTDSFTYRVCDDGGLCAEATATTSVTPVADPPVAADDEAATAEDVPVTIAVLANDADVDSPLVPSTVRIVGPPARGSATVDPATGAVTYVPDPQASGLDVLAYEVCDTTGLCDTASVVVAVGAVADPPQAAPDTASTAEDAPVTVDVLANDADPEDDLDPASVRVIDLPSGATATVDPATGRITFTPPADASGELVITYQVCDRSTPTPLCATATVTITVAEADDPPVAGPDRATTNEDAAVAIAVLADDVDPDGDQLTVTAVGTPSAGSAAVEAGGVVRYTPPADFTGTATFTYTVSDGRGGSATATVTVVVEPVNDPPVAADDTASTPEDVAVVIDVLGNDRDVEERLDPTSVRPVLDPRSGATATVDPPTGRITFTPAPGTSGTTTFTYEVCDLDGACTTAVVTVLVADVNDPPVAGDDSAATDEDVPVTIPVLADDVDEDGTLDPATVRVTSGPANGTATVDPATGATTYAPAPGTSGTDSFTYVVCDDDGACTDPATVTVLVGGVADAPVAGDDLAATDEDVPVTVTVTTNDTDPDGDLVPGSVRVVDQPAGGTLVAGPGAGQLTFTPAPGFAGTTSGRYEVCDATAPVALCDVAVLTITVSEVNDPPVASPDRATTAEDVPVAIAVLADDLDPDGDPLTVVAVGTPTAGTATLQPDGTIRFFPPADFAGTATLTYDVADGRGGTATGTVTVVVDPVDDAPVARPDAASTPEDTPVTIDVLANDSDVEGRLDPASTTVILVPPTLGTAVVDPATGRITYTPGADVSGVDVVRYEVCDLEGACDTAEVTVTIAAANDRPVAGDDAAATPSGAAVTVDVLANDVDRDGALVPATVAIVAGPTGGTATVDPATGAITFTPAPGFAGTATTTYRVCDDGGLCDEAVLTVTVGVANVAPLARDDAAGTGSGQPVAIPVLGNDADGDGELVAGTVTVTVPARNGTTAVDPATGAVTYTPNRGFGGVDAFTYRVCDDDGACDEAVVTVTVAPPAEAAATAVPDLELAKRLESSLVAGQLATYVITVANRGTGVAEGPILVTDELPAALTYVGAEGASCSASGQVVTCTSPSPLAEGAALTIRLQVRVVGSPGTAVANTASVAPAAGEADQADNRATTAPAAVLGTPGPTPAGPAPAGPVPSSPRPSGPSGPSTSGIGALPRTGAALAPVTLAGFALVAGGLGLLVVGRRRRSARPG